MIRCQKCGENDHPAEAIFCHMCGAKLSLETVERPKEYIGRDFEWAESFSEGLAWVVINGATGFIDKKGQIIIKPIYDLEGSYSFGMEVSHGFSEGLAAVRIGGGTMGKYGYIDHSGKYIIHPMFDCAWAFSNGLAPVRIKGRWRFIYRDGTSQGLEVPPEYGYVNHFSEGLASVKLLEGNWAFVDKTGRVVYDRTKNLIFNMNSFPLGRPKFTFTRPFRDGMARVECAGTLGYINTGGKFFKVAYKSVDDFSEGLARFSDDYSKSGYIDKTMKVVIRPMYEGAGDFHEGRATVRSGTKWGYIDTSGNLVIPYQYDEVAPFYEGMAAVKINGIIGYINSSGIMVVPPRFTSARGFSEGLAAVEENGRWRFIDKAGNYAF